MSRRSNGTNRSAQASSASAMAAPSWALSFRATEPPHNGKAEAAAAARDDNVAHHRGASRAS
jgi:hypothetical protein